MYPVAHMTAAVVAVSAGEYAWRRVRSSGGRPRPQLDYRFVALGALLPDAIDKPFAWFGPHFLSYSATSGHTAGHTLLFSLALVALGAMFARGGNARPLCLGLGSLMHLPVDPAIAYPHLLFWPAFGWDFPNSHGIPGLYLRIFDGGMIAGYAVALLAGEDLRRRMWRLVAGGVSPFGAAGMGAQRGVERGGAPLTGGPEGVPPRSVRPTKWAGRPHSFARSERHKHVRQPPSSPPGTDLHG
jgi:hypothetical protein